MIDAKSPNFNPGPARSNRGGWHLRVCQNFWPTWPINDYRMHDVIFPSFCKKTELIRIHHTINQSVSWKLASTSFRKTSLDGT